MAGWLERFVERRTDRQLDRLKKTAEKVAADIESGHYHERELRKIPDAIHPRTGAARLVAARIQQEGAFIRTAGDATLVQRRHIAAEQRREALKAGASSYSHPAWAAASAGETWLTMLSNSAVARLEKTRYELFISK